MKTHRSPNNPTSGSSGARHSSTGTRSGILTLWMPAKVNLFLEVRGKRPDGYHDIATLMVAVNLFDTMELYEDSSGTISLRCSHPHVPTGPDNLIHRAAHALRSYTGVQAGASIRLIKRIPIEAGLAGGSSNAAGALAGLNRLWKLGLSRTKLHEIAAQIGSDVPFFLDGPVAWCTGRGEEVTPMEPSEPERHCEAEARGVRDEGAAVPARERHCEAEARGVRDEGAAVLAMDLVLVTPPFGLKTAAVYQGVVVPPQPINGEEIRAAYATGNREQLGRCLHNRLQASAEAINPRLGEIRARLENMGSAGVLMSGSGSCLFALCRNRREARRILDEIHRDRHPAFEGCRIFMVRSCVSGLPQP